MHPIRLHGPWRLIETDEPLTDDRQSPTIKLKIPDDWTAWQPACSNSTEMVQLDREFGLPTNLDEDQTIDLVIETKNVSAKISLNEEPIGELTNSETEFRFEIGSRLLARNRLRLDLTRSDSNSNCQQLTFGSIEAVRLEIS